VPAIVWKDEYSVGVKVIDDQHKELFRRVNKLFDDVSRGNVTTVLETLDFLNSYVIYHFSAEEQLMDKSRTYPELESHKNEHEWFKSEILSIREQVEKNGLGVSLTLRLNKLLVSWLINHVTKTDVKFAPYLKEEAV